MCVIDETFFFLKENKNENGTRSESANIIIYDVLINQKFLSVKITVFIKQRHENNRNDRIFVITAVCPCTQHNKNDILFASK